MSEVRLGDMVLYDGHTWDVVGVNTLDRLDVTERPQVVLRLERVYRPPGRRKVVYHDKAAPDQVTVIGHQDQLFDPAPVTPAAADRAVDDLEGPHEVRGGSSVRETVTADGTRIREVTST